MVFQGTHLGCSSLGGESNQINPKIILMLKIQMFNTFGNTVITTSKQRRWNYSLRHACHSESFFFLSMSQGVIKCIVIYTVGSHYIN